MPDPSRRALLRTARVLSVCLSLAVSAGLVVQAQRTARGPSPSAAPGVDPPRPSSTGPGIPAPAASLPPASSGGPAPEAAGDARRVPVFLMTSKSLILDVDGLAARPPAPVAARNSLALANSSAAGR